MNLNPINSTLAQQPGLPEAITDTEQNTANQKALSSDFETFLRMLTVQLQNQDPLNPVEASDYAVQLATFSGVEQQVRTNELLTGLGDQFQLLGLSQFAGWVGMEARYSGPIHYEGTPIEVAMDIPDNAGAVQLIARTPSGTEVARRTLPDTNGQVIWDGTSDDGTVLPFGSYVLFSETFLDGKSQGVSPAQSYARVDQARFEDGSAILTLANGTDITPGDVSGLRGDGQAPST